ncbi:hypothetical protein [Methylobacterium soli]|uniref:Uncharacterized protein n=1 Tax=Methylobacterium soli TaxID=553447 RepID=A0A6L3SP71_9HYPH|nr:hypothetical protein [Methylobacterium soli]KAB1070803.1 hypothetical protein F6X53_29710 [Methylobacterium soli]GJE42429.1 hypothetical protein AEGHOMDF_1601 [Methylobacterium soli]
MSTADEGQRPTSGKDAYAAFGATIAQSSEAVAAYCETAEGAAMSGCWYLASHRCLLIRAGGAGGWNWLALCSTNGFTSPQSGRSASVAHV